MTTHLLDANVLIALVVEDHEQHQRAVAWSGGADAIALCPVTEGALVRFLARMGERPSTVTAILRVLHDHPRVAFWPDDLSYAATDLTGVHGHRQVTDAHLAALAHHHDAVLATFDEGLSALRPATTVLVPAGP